MLTLFTLFKFVHVASVTVWVGGVAALSLLNLRIARNGEPAALFALASLSEFYGSTVIAPAAGLTLIAGIVMIAASGYALASLWVGWGFLVMIASMTLGAWPIRRASQALAAVAQAPAPDQARMAALCRRLAGLGLTNLLLLLSAVAAMVFKPSS